MTRSPNDEGHWDQEPYSRATAYEFAYRALRKALLDGEFPEGSRLFQSEIATRLEVSTTPVREALQKLTSEGLVDFVPGRGAIVHTLTLNEWSEIVSIRGLLEPFILRLAAERIEASDLAELRRIHRLMERETNVANWVDLNRQFHCAYYAVADSPRLTAVLTGLQEATTTYVARGIRQRPDIRQEGGRDHAAIIEGLDRRDPDAIAEVVLRHVATILPLK